MEEHSRIDELLGPYVLGALDPEEEQRIEAHLAECHVCREEAEKLHQLNRFLDQAWTPPPPNLKTRIMRELPRRGRSRSWRPALAAAAVLAVVLIAGTIYAEVLQRRETVAASATLSPTELAPGAGGQVRLESAGTNTRVELRVSGLPRLRSSEYYEFWFVGVAGKRISGGGFTVDSGGQATVRMNAPDVADEYPNVGITLEETPGDPRPSRDKVLGGALRQTE